MIYLYSGTPGSGKSLHMARTLYYWLRSGNTAICNFDIDISKIKNCKGNFIYLDNEFLTPDNLIKFSRVYFSKQGNKFKEGAIRLYIDECQLIFNARDWQQSGRNKWLSFYTQHRKYGYDVFLVAQFDKMIDKQIRSLIEYEYIHRKVNNCGFWGKIFSSVVLFRPLFVCVKVWYPMSEKVGSEFFTANKKFYSLYDTYNTFDSFKSEKLLDNV